MTDSSSSSAICSSVLFFCNTAVHRISDCNLIILLALFCLCEILIYISNKYHILPQCLAPLLQILIIPRIDIIHGAHHFCTLCLPYFVLLWLSQEKSICKHRLKLCRQGLFQKRLTDIPDTEEQNMEIERKFLFHKLPDQLDTYPHYGIEQAYVTTNPVIRVRKKTLYDAASAVSNCQYVLTVKSSGMLAKQEFELPIDEDAYRTLCAKADGNVIAKTRYKIPLNQGLTLELDLFEGLFDGLVMGEVEFPEFILISMINMLPLSAICSN